MIFNQQPPTPFDSKLQHFYTTFSSTLSTILDKHLNEEKWKGFSCEYMNIDMYRYAMWQAYLIKSDMDYSDFPLSYYYKKYNVQDLVHNFACHKIDFDDILALFDINFKKSDTPEQYYKTFGYSTDDPSTANKTIDFKSAVKYLNYQVEVNTSYINLCETAEVVSIYDYVEQNFPPTLEDQINTILVHNELQGLQGGDGVDYYHLTLAQIVKLNKLLVVLEGAPTENTPGAFGQFYIDDDYVYVCIKEGGAGTALWKRMPLHRYYNINE